jgi:hypothetical protein
MRLSVGSQPVALPVDATISVEKLSPVLSDEVGSFSFPFPVPTRPNQRVLGWPGKLERAGEIADKTFILEDHGVQVLRGEVEYDSVTRDEIGVVLKSGLTEFFARLEDANDGDGARMADLDLGSEAWFGTGFTTWDAFMAKLTAWDDTNRDAEGAYAVAPFRVTTESGVTFDGNKHDNTSHLVAPDIWVEGVGSYFQYMLQFRVWWLIGKIFEAYGYTVLQNDLKDGDFSGLVLLSRTFSVSIQPVDLEAYPEAVSNDITVWPFVENLVYAYLMPDVKVQDFLDEMKTLAGIRFIIDDQKKEIKIVSLKNIMTATGESAVLTELSGWEHKEERAGSGYLISFQGQADELDTRDDYVVNSTVDNLNDVSPPNYKDIVVHVNSYHRDYISIESALLLNPPYSYTSINWWYAGWYYKAIGRFKPYTFGRQETKIECNVLVPIADQVEANLWKGPSITASFGVAEHDMTMASLSEIMVSLYRGLVSNSVIVDVPVQLPALPLLSADRYFTNVTVWLSPEGLYMNVYSDYLTWKNSRVRSFTKYIQTSLPELLTLAWDKTYVMNGIRVILSKISYELPFTGIVKVEGFVL